MIAGALSCAVALGAPAFQDAFQAVELRLEGPLSEVTIEGGGWTTRVVGELGAGEVRTLRVPVVVADVPLQAAAPALSFAPSDGGGDAALAPASSPPPSWEALPAGLRRRTLPPVHATRIGPGAPRLALIAAAAVLSLAFWRKTPAALAAGIAACALCFVLPDRPPPRVALEVLEGDGASGRWLRVRGALSTLEVEAGSAGWCESMPVSSERRLEVTLAGGLRWTLVGEGLALYALAPGGDLGRLGPEGNEVRDLAAAWRRDGAGRWTFHGPWGRGDPLPAARAGAGDPAGDPASAPPGWLMSALPQGVGVTLGRAAAGTGGVPLWVRWVEGPSFNERR